VPSPRLSHFALSGALILLAQSWPAEAKPRTVRDRAGGIATQPLRDLNMMPATISEELQSIQDDPYDTRHLDTCAAIARAVTALDAVLPPDVDAAVYTGDPRSVGEALMDVGGDMIAGLMPFRGVVRAVSGASIAEARRRYAVNRGEARRSFLKGLGLARGCAPPAAPAPLIAYEFGL